MVDNIDVRCNHADMSHEVIVSALSHTKYQTNNNNNNNNNNNTRTVAIKVQETTSETSNYAV